MPKQQKFAEFIEALVASEMDGDNPEWWTPLFAFTRAVKNWHTDGVQLDRAFNAVDGAMRRLGGWSVLGLDDVQDTESAYEFFTYAWDRVRFHADERPLQQALVKAKAYPLSTTRVHGRRMPKYDRFVSVAGWLQVTAGNRNILLPVRQVAELLSTDKYRTDKHRVSIWRELAKKDGFLAVAKQHVFRSGGVGRATEFRFDVSRWDCLRAAAALGCKAHFDFAQQHPPEAERTTETDPDQ